MNKLNQVLYEKRMDELKVDQIENIILERIGKYFREKNLTPEIKSYLSEQNYDYAKTTTIRFLNKIVYVSSIVRDEKNYSELIIFSTLPKDIFRVPQNLKVVHLKIKTKR